MRKLLTATLVVFLLCAPAVAQERSKGKVKPRPPAEAAGGSAPAPELRKIIYVPREEFMRVVDPAKQGRVIEFEEYLRLERLGAGIKEPEPPAPLPALLTGARYRGTVGETQAAMFSGGECGGMSQPLLMSHLAPRVDRQRASVCLRTLPGVPRLGRRRARSTPCSPIGTKTSIS